MNNKPMRYYWRIYEIGKMPDHERHSTHPYAWQTKSIEKAKENILRMARHYCCTFHEWPKRITLIENFQRGLRFNFGSSHYYGYVWEKPIK